VISCTQLPRKEKWQEKFSAFRVVVDIEDKDTVLMRSYGRRVLMLETGCLSHANVIVSC